MKREYISLYGEEYTTIRIVESGVRVAKFLPRAYKKYSAKDQIPWEELKKPEMSFPFIKNSQDRLSEAYASKTPLWIYQKGKGIETTFPDIQKISEDPLEVTSPVESKVTLIDLSKSIKKGSEYDNSSKNEEVKVSKTTEGTLSSSQKERNEMGANDINQFSSDSSND
jgi:hypothetical protein